MPLQPLFEHHEEPRATTAPIVCRNSPESPPPALVQADSFSQALAKFTREHRIAAVISNSTSDDVLERELRSERKREAFAVPCGISIEAADAFMSWARDVVDSEGKTAITVECLRLEFGYSRATAYRRLQYLQAAFGLPKERRTS